MNSGYVNSNSNKIYDYNSLSLNTAPQNNNNTVPDEGQYNNTQVQYTDDNALTNNTSGRIPNNSVSFGDELPALSEIVPMNDSNDLPPLDELMGQEPMLEYNDYQAEEKESNKDHSISKAIYTVEWGLARNFIAKKATNVITKNVAESVSKAVIETLGKTSAKTSAKVAEQSAVKATEAILKGVTSGEAKVIAELTKTGQLGKGIASVTLRESGGVFKAIQTGSKATVEVISKEVAQQGIAKGTSAILKKTIIGGGEKALETGIKAGMEKATKEILQTASTQGLNKATAAAVEKATVEATTKTISKASVKAATTTQKILTGVNIAVGAGITIWDTVDAINKTKDENTSTASKVLAWTTVGLDAASTVSTATGKGKAFGTVAGFVSIGTSLLSDIVRYKN